MNISHFKTYEAFALAVLLGGIVVAVLFCLLAYTYDENAYHSNGINSELASYITASYSPAWASSLASILDTLFKRLSANAARQPQTLHNLCFFYGFAGSGIFVGILALVLVGFFVRDLDRSKFLITTAASFWSFTVGLSYLHVFKK